MKVKTQSDFSEGLVDQVLNELNITMANQIPGKLF